MSEEEFTVPWATARESLSCAECTDGGFNLTELFAHVMAVHKKRYRSQVDEWGIEL